MKLVYCCLTAGWHGQLSRFVSFSAMSSSGKFSLHKVFWRFGVSGCVQAPTKAGRSNVGDEGHYGLCILCLLSNFANIYC